MVLMRVCLSKNHGARVIRVRWFVFHAVAAILLGQFRALTLESQLNNHKNLYQNNTADDKQIVIFLSVDYIAVGVTRNKLVNNNTDGTERSMTMSAPRATTCAEGQY
jgi:hypothetical protein